MTADAADAPPLLAARGLTKRYGTVTVLDGVSMDVRGGEVHALLGANGAGKSTLCKILSGLTPASAGSATLGGAAYAPASKREAEAAGVEIVQQELNLIGTLSVAENLLFARLPNRLGVLRVGRLHAEARAILDRFGLPGVDPGAPVRSLGVGRQQMVEIAAALARDCRVLILDEPTAALSDTEAGQLFGHLRDLRDRGVAVVYISHRLDEVKELSDRVTVLRDGRHVVTRDTAGLSTDAMVALMSGEERDAGPSAFRSHRREGDGERDVALRVRGLCRGPVRDVSLEVRRGERLGVTGLVGSGRTELLRAIFGADRATAGTVAVNGVPRGRFRHPRAAVEAGLAMVTEDRKSDGLLLAQPVGVNATLCSLWTKFCRFGLLRGAAERRATAGLIEDLDVRCHGPDQLAGQLSGGNQQKVAVGKWLVRGADVLLFDEPTRGIDVAARRRIYRLLEALAAEGKACVIVSSDLEELFETCDAIAVLCDGRLTGTFQRGEWTREKILQASFDSDKAAPSPAAADTSDASPADRRA
ncbi:sugar ABC transporter ATP-binding protein [Alienimonas chondri]|uniref:Galactose/methyl galactoside import ATP-binding protein MglA n=1 Tax=Alienimonas chondri TaxID=2681879 RepID=A0ABX1VG59_9PLAN|nr:sugar ABC transporter ATP-binding protein [Alienimonas chondri]NNJ26252.1 Galactose/methyl galactoside import ATP-binding protein MglA [Alienimonas chondri]